MQAFGVGVGYGTDWLAKKAGLNQSQSIILGMITSFGTSKGLNALDTKFNVSGFKKVPGNIGNPSENPKVLADAFEDQTAVYGYKPNETGSLKEFAKYDWSDPDVVAEFRSNRIDYISEHNTYQKLFETMKASGCTDTEIAQALVSERNMSRLASYIDDSGQIIDTDLYNQAVENCVSYKDLRNGFGGKLPKTDLEIIESAMRTNPAMDACCGLYGHNN